MSRKVVVDSILAAGRIMDRKQAEIAVDEVAAAIKRTAVGKQRVTLIGFGTFSEVFRKGRIARNLRTGEAVQVPGRLTLTFKPVKGS